MTTVMLLRGAAISAALATVAEAARQRIAEIPDDPDGAGENSTLASAAIN